MKQLNFTMIPDEPLPVPEGSVPLVDALKESISQVAPNVDATRLINTFLLELAKQYGGDRHYIATKPMRDARDLDIIRNAPRRGVASMASKYGLSPRRIQEICAAYWQNHRPQSGHNRAKTNTKE